MNSNTSSNHSFADVTSLLDSFEAQLQQLDHDTDAALHQLQVNTYQFLIQLQQQKLELYSRYPVGLERLQQLDHLLIALLECAKSQHTQSCSSLRQAQNALRAQIKANCVISLYFEPPNEPNSSPTQFPPLTEIDLGALFNE